MQTNTRKIRIILSEEFGLKHTDPIVIKCADRLYKELTGQDVPKKDALGGWLEMGQAKLSEMQEVTEILQTFERELRRKDDLAGNADWQDFARGFIRREIKIGHDFKVWLTWYRQDPMRMEWAWKVTPTTIKQRWLMAFDPVPSQKLPSGV